MTHDEWISDLNKYIAVAEIGTPATAKMVKALRAVIEICKEAQYDIDVSGFAEGIMRTIEEELQL